MKLSITKEKLVGPLQAVNNVVERRQTLPVLSNLLISGENGVVTLTGTDMEVEVVARVEAPIENEGQITVPARKLLDIVKALPAGANCTFNLSGEKLTVRSGKSRFVLSTIPAREFPTLGEGDSRFDISVDAQTLRWLIDSTQFAMAHQDVRYYLNGLLLDLKEGGINAVTTDGHRLAFSHAAVEHSAATDTQLILPRKGVQEIRRMLADKEGPVTLNASAGQLRLAVDGQQLTTKLIDGNFPDYERVIPTGTKHKATGDRLLLRDGLNRASVLSNEKFRGIRACFEPGVLRAVAHNPEHEEAEEEMELGYDGEPVEIGFNVGYLLDVLNVIDDEDIAFHFTDADKSCLITPATNQDTKYVVMPMRL